MAEAKRTRNWVFILYPESCKENWRQILSEETAYIVSPLHDKDVIEDGSGTLKKAHWHIVLTFSTVKTYEQALEVTKSIGGTIPQAVKDIKGKVRYFTHIDNPEKHQYKREDIELVGNPPVDLESFFVSKTDIKNTRKEMFAYMIDNGITEFADLVDYARKEKEDWFNTLVESDYMLIKYIESARNRKKQTAPKLDDGKVSALAKGAEDD